MQYTRRGVSVWRIPIPKYLGGHLALRMHQLLQPLLDDLPPLEGAPDLVRRIRDDVPVPQLLGDVAQVALLGLPLGVAADLDARADQGHGHVAGLDGAAAGHVALRQRVGHEVLLQLREQELARLVGAPAPDAVRLGAALEERARDPVEPERRQDAPDPEQEAPPRGAEAAEEVFVQRVDEQQAFYVAAVAGGEDSGVDRSDAGAHQD